MNVNFMKLLRFIVLETIALS